MSVPSTSVQANNAFSGNILRAIFDSSPNNNVFISPFSLSLSLTMAMLGSKGNTRKEMTHSLGLDDQSEMSISGSHKQLMSDLNHESTKMANRVFVKEGLVVQDNFNRLLSTWYSVICTTATFGTDPKKAANEINAWVSEATDELIPKIVTPDQLDSATSMIIANAVHFKSSWLKKFDETHTTNLPFYINSQTEIEAKTMFQKGSFKIMHHTAADCNVIELPYSDNQTKMVVFLPDEKTGLDKIIAAFGPQMLAQVSDQFRSVKTNVWLPVFKIEESYSLGPILAQDLSMKDAFTPGKADFSGIAGSPGDLFIGEVIHKAVIDVNEEGTEAAAATIIRIKTRSLFQEEEIDFRVDHPFLFAILDKDNVLFAGVLRKPEIAIEKHEEL